MENRKKLAVISLAMSCMALTTVALTLSETSNEFYIASAACAHDGNHYTEHNASDTECGCKEYWICCDCHTIFTKDKLGSASFPAGTWKDNGRANLDFTEADKDDPRYIPKIAAKEMMTILTNMGFGKVTQLEDGTWQIGSYDEKKHSLQIVIPEGVSVIEPKTFKGNAIDYVVVPYSVTTCESMTWTGASVIKYFFVGDTNETTSSLACSYLYKIQEVGWHYENGEPVPNI